MDEGSKNTPQAPPTEPQPAPAPAPPFFLCCISCCICHGFVLQIAVFNEQISFAAIGKAKENQRRSVH